MTDQAPEQRSLFYKDDLLRFVPNPVSQGAALEPQGETPLTPSQNEHKKRYE